MTVQDVLGRQSLQLPEYSCENSVPISKEKKKSEIQILEGQNGSKEKPGCLK